MADFSNVQTLKAQVMDRLGDNMEARKEFADALEAMQASADGSIFDQYSAMQKLEAQIKGEAETNLLNSIIEDARSNSNNEAYKAGLKAELAGFTQILLEDKQAAPAAVAEKQEETGAAAQVDAETAKRNEEETARLAAKKDEEEKQAPGGKPGLFEMIKMFIGKLLASLTGDESLGGMLSGLFNKQGANENVVENGQSAAEPTPALPEQQKEANLENAQAQAANVKVGGVKTTADVNGIPDQNPNKGVGTQNQGEKISHAV